MSATPAGASPDEPRPTPGSAAAAALGCSCPVLINGPAAPSGNLLIAPDCTLHSASDS